ncbi:translation initiation factor [Merismopedia glauca]|uniref:Stress response translation initiation inhibitor YciH n=1 Tax=Merismopedia glauca CCAP 1448/3 TaxID=1296344 RepID=A0A2T1C1M0_9CYAN|nr:translation initiation factor [Merismopedia glauca]PSB02068.1 stress response translation initiation inhibitor YciH [Merismopedia glauca CCAP 1448/3]
MSSTKTPKPRIVYQEFGNSDPVEATQRPSEELPANQHKLKVEASRKGRKGKTVTVVSGFQVSPETLQTLLKQLKAQCGAGGTIKDNEIEIQGDHKQKLVEILTNLGYKVKSSGG